MSPKTISMFGKGQVTLPKEYREQFDTNIYMARQDGERLILEPIIPNHNYTKKILLLTENPSFDFLKDEPDLYE